jgi:hypothetical protein
MFDEYLGLLFEKIKNFKYIKQVLAICSLVAVLFIVWSTFLSKGTLKVTTTGLDGQAVVTINKLVDGKVQTDPKAPVTKLIGREAEVKLKPGRYKVTSEVTSEQNRVDNVKLQSFKEVEIKARSTTNLELKVFKPESAGLNDLLIKPTNIGFVGNSIYMINSYGSLLYFDQSSRTSKSIKAGGIPLDQVVLVCGFGNGNAIAATSSGSLYKVQEAEASTITLDANEDEGFIDFGDVSTSLAATKNWLCDKDKLILIKGFQISDQFVVSAYDNLDPFNSTPTNIDINLEGDVWFYKKVDIDSFDHSGGPSDLSKKVVRISPDGTKKELEIEHYASQLSSGDHESFCYYYGRSIYCGNVNSGVSKEVFTLPDNLSISNIVMLDSKRLAYSYSNTAWVINLESGVSSQIYSSEYSILPYSINYDRVNKKLIFATQQESTGKQSLYRVPLLVIGDFAL